MLQVVRAKACKRCGGDLSIECDIYGVYIQCIQCSATWEEQDIALTTTRHAQKSLKAIIAKKPLTPHC